jgi:hypothetical protein
MKTAELLDLIYHALPAVSGQEIADRIGVPRTSVIAAIGVLRAADPDVYRWTIPHVKRGPSLDNRYFPVLIDPDGTTVVHDDCGDAFTDGCIGTVRDIASKARNETTAAKMIVSQLPSKAMKRTARSVARALEYVADQMHELDEALTEQRLANGTDKP